MKRLTLVLLLLTGCGELTLVHQLPAPVQQAIVSNGWTIIEIVDPCGDAAGIFDEVFLRLSNGTLIASFSDSASGNNTRFSVIVDGVNYKTTDGSNCYFSVTPNDFRLFNEHY